MKAFAFNDDIAIFGFGVTIGIALTFILMLATGFGQDVPGTGGLTRQDVAEMIIDCEAPKFDTECVVDVGVRPADAN